MGCGKSKHDVASGNTVIQRKKSSTVESNAGQENIGTETNGTNNSNNNVVVVDNESSKVLKQKNDENIVNESINDNVKGKSPDEVTNVQQDKALLEKSHEVDAAAENKTQENEIIIAAEGENLVKEEETKSTNQEENLAEEEEKIKETTQEEALAKEEETNVSTSEGEQKDLKADGQGQ